VKYIYTFLALLGIVFASHAQQPASENAEGKNFDKSKSQRVASPNRTSSRDWARSHKSDKSDKHNRDKDSSNRAAIVWVDSTGATVGRALALGIGDILVTFDNEPTALRGLAADQNCDSNFVCTYSGGARWRNFPFVVNFTSIDCTGTPYLSSFIPFGTPKFGVPIFDGGETYIYIANVTQSSVQTTQSAFFDGECRSSLSGAANNVSPVIAVIPASTFGIEPYYLK
jgi:hypothetical protein